MPLIYFNNLWLIPRLLSRRKYGRYLLALLLALLAYAPVAAALIEALAKRAHMTIVLSSSSYVANVGGLAFVILISTIIKLSTGWFLQQRTIEQLENQQLRSELTALRNQLNPHFLFNTLNTLYALTLTHSQTAPEVILKLSQIMRYVVYECERDFVPLSKEIKYIEDFVALQKLRCGNRAHIELSVEGTPHNLEIAPLILITFVENAFKHGVKNEYKRTFVTIHLAVQDQALTFCVRNSLPSPDPAHQPGIGLRNVRQRLDLLYGPRHTLAITTPASVYQVQLTLQLASRES